MRKPILLKIALIAVSVLLAVAQQAVAEPERSMCGPADVMTGALSHDKHEIPAIFGAMQAGAEMVWMREPSGGSWTLLTLERVNGHVLACIVADGPHSSLTGAR